MAEWKQINVIQPNSILMNWMQYQDGRQSNIYYFSRRKRRSGNYCQSDKVLRLKSGKMKCLSLIYSPGLAKMDELPRAGVQITLLLSQMSTAHISMEEHQNWKARMLSTKGATQWLSRLETYEERWSTSWQKP